MFSSIDRTRSAAAPKGPQTSTKPSAPPHKKPATKRPSKPGTSRKRSRNVEPDPEIPSEPELRSLMRLPLELLFEIAKQLHPFNLILLSRTNKYLRHHLMSGSAIKIWQSSLRTVEGLPPCPNDLCEPQYAALVFVGECSTCGVVTPRDMDPILHVRLCEKCVKQRVAHIRKFSISKIQLVSVDIIPAKHGGHKRKWCLYHEAKTVETEYKRRVNGDKRELNQWIAERLVYTQKRYAEAQSLREWAVGKELDGFKSARKTDIEARLVKLGWERADFQSEDSRRQWEWTCLVYNTKPMDDQVWEELLPCLLEHLEANRRNRLKKEAGERESVRRQMLHKYMVSLRGQLQPIVQATLKLQTTNAAETDYLIHWCLHLQRLSFSPMFPITHNLNFCPESTALIKTDMSMETFELEFPSKAAQILQQIDEARSAFEGRLVQMLPNDTQPVDSQGTEFDLVAVTDEDAQSLDILPLGTRKLLRADAIFKTSNGLLFYPSDFCWPGDPSHPTYDSDSASLAQSLLNTLGRSNASYLEMKALGRSFVCGRCNYRQICYTWKELIVHYRSQASEWQVQSEQVARSLQAGETFAFVFTHDTSRIDSNKSLVRLVHQWPATLGAVHESQKCKLCDSVGIRCFRDDGYMPDHVRDVHLIDNPVEGVHYEPALP